MSKEKILYLECGTGISGDMAVAALLDLGADEEKLRRVLAGIPGGGFRIGISRVKKSGIDCCDFDVILDEVHDGHDHDMEYLYGHLQSGLGHEHGYDHDYHDHDHGDDHHHHEHHDHDDDHHHHEHHDHDHDHHHDHYHGHDHHHHHTGMAEIREIIGGLSMTDGARALALRIFGILAEAEAEEFASVLEGLSDERKSKIAIDFSIIADTSYYNGISFEGYIDGIPECVLVGGRYDRLMRRMKKKSRAIGFAVYLDTLGLLGRTAGDQAIESFFSK